MSRQTYLSSPIVGRRVGVVRLLSILTLVGAGTSVPAAGQLPAPPVVARGPLEWGGYGSLVMAKPEHPEEIEQDQIREFSAALMLWGRIGPSGSYLAELDVAKRTSETWTGREVDERLTPVRLYLEYEGSERFRLRAGRFLTPFGQWNESHAEPLTWTPTRPLTTYRAFSKSITGLLAAGTASDGKRDWGYAVYWAPGHSVAGGGREAEETSVLSAVGARVGVELKPGLSLGLSGSRARRSRPVLEPLPWDGEARFLLSDPGESGEDPEEDERDVEAHGRPILGADLGWQGAGVRMLAEGVWVPAGEGNQPSEGGAFVLGSVRLGGGLWAVGKAEYYRPVDERSGSVGYLGLTIRRSSRLVLKGGYQLAQHPSRRIPSGWFVSFSSLF